MRRWRRNLLLAALIAAALSVGYVVAGVERPVEALSFATAYVGLGLLVATLSIGPLNLMRTAPNPVSTHLRRDLGVWAALVGTAHTVLGLQVHKGGNLSGYFILPEAGDGSRLNSAAIFVLTNYMGALATILFIMLIFLSNDFALRRLGTRTWKSLQRWSYVLLAIVVLHGILYQYLEKRRGGAVLLFGLLVAGVSCFQLGGIAIRRRRPAGD